MEHLFRGPNRHPECDPANTPEAKRGRPPMCSCNSKECRLCRERASKRRWYRRNKAEQQKRVRENLRKWRLKQKRQREVAISDEEMDRRALAGWRSEWGTREQTI